jgi:hypothetical protein
VIDDFNGDGNQDVAGLCGGGFISVLRGDGAGNFSLIKQVVPVDWSFTYNALSGDFNNDGHPDLAFSGGSNAVILIGDGTGHFSSVRSVPLPEPAFSVMEGDFNNDGNLDLALSSSSLLILLGDGTGGFPSRPLITVRSGSGVLESGDFNNDGALDLVLRFVNNQPTTALVLLNNGAAEFTVSTSLSLKNFSGATVSDVNGDGNPDLIFTGQIQLEILLGNGLGQFAEAYRNGPVNFDSGEAVVAGDFNGDGHPDFFLNLFGNTAVRLQQPAAAPESYSVRDVCAPASCILSVLGSGGFAAGPDVAIYPNSPGIISFPKPAGATFIPLSVNRFGAIAGTTVTTAGSTPTLWLPTPDFFLSEIWNLSSVHPSTTRATYVNDNNEIMGDSDGARPVLGLVPGSPLSRVSARTNNGVVLGSDPNGPLAWSSQTGRIYLKSPAGLPVPLGPASFNGIGQVLLTTPFVGQVLTPGAGTYNQPEAPGFIVRAFNARGEFVGLMGEPPSRVPAIYTAGGGVVPLASMLASVFNDFKTTWTLTDVVAINDNGQILVLATSASGTTTFLLTPGGSFL